MYYGVYTVIIIVIKKIQNNVYTVTYFKYCLTIRLLARNFYEVIVDEGKARVNYHIFIL